MILKTISGFLSLARYFLSADSFDQKESHRWIDPAKASSAFLEISSISSAFPDVSVRENGST